MTVEKIEINGLNGKMEDYFQSAELQLGKLFVLSSGFGNEINGIKPEQFIANQIVGNVMSTTDLEPFTLLQKAIIDVNDCLLDFNKGKMRLTGGSVIVMLMGEVESICMYVGSTTLNLSVSTDGVAFKKLHSTEHQLFEKSKKNNNNALMKCLGFKRIVMLEKITTPELTVSKTDNTEKVINRTSYVPVPEVEYNKNADYVISFKRLNTKKNSKGNIRKVRFLMSSSGFHQAMAPSVKEKLITKKCNLSNVKAYYESLIKCFIQNHDYKTSKYNSITGVLVEMAN